MNINESSSRLHASLQNFVALCNANQDLPKLTRKWERHVHIKPKDAPSIFTLQVGGGEDSILVEGELKGRPSLTLSGPAEVLADVLSGEVNPAEALIGMGLEIYGAEEDVMKLDAITLVLWDW